MGSTKEKQKRMSHNRVFSTADYILRCDVRKKIMADKLREKFEPLGKYVTLEILGGNEDESEPDEEDDSIPPSMINEKTVAPPPPPPKTAKPKKAPSLPMPTQENNNTNSNKKNNNIDDEEEDDFESIFAPAASTQSKKALSPKTTTNKKPEPLVNTNQTPQLKKSGSNTINNSSKKGLNKINRINNNNNSDDDINIDKEKEKDEELTKTPTRVKGKKPDPANVGELINFLTDCANCIEDIRDQIFVNTNLPSVYNGKVQLRDCTIDGKFEIGSTLYADGVVIIGKKKMSILDTCNLEWFRISECVELVGNGKEYYTSIDDIGCRIQLRIRYGSEYLVTETTPLNGKDFEEVLTPLLRKGKDITYPITHISGLTAIDMSKGGKQAYLQILINKEKIKIRKGGQTMIKEFHGQQSYVLKTQQSDCTFAVLINGRNFEFSANDPFSCQSIITLCRVFSAKRTFGILLEHKTTDSAPLGPMASLVRARRSILPQEWKPYNPPHQPITQLRRVQKTREKIESVISNPHIHLNEKQLCVVKALYTVIGEGELINTDKESQQQLSFNPAEDFLKSMNSSINIGSGSVGSSKKPAKMEKSDSQVINDLFGSNNNNATSEFNAFPEVEPFPGFGDSNNNNNNSSIGFSDLPFSNSPFPSNSRGGSTTFTDNTNTTTNTGNNNGTTTTSDEFDFSNIDFGDDDEVVAPLTSFNPTDPDLFKQIPPWGMNDEDYNKWRGYFYQLSKGSLTITLGEAYPTFKLSGLSHEILSEIAKLVVDVSLNRLTEAEFCVMMQMIMVIKKYNRRVPVSLPRCYYKFIPMSFTDFAVFDEAARSRLASRIDDMDLPTTYLTEKEQMPEKKGDYIWNEKYNLWYNPKTQYYFDAKRKLYTQTPPEGPWMEYKDGKLKRVSD